MADSPTIHLNRFGLYPLIIDESMRIVSISSTLASKLGHSSAELRGSMVVRLMHMEFFQELFVRKEIWELPFQNYRAFLRTADGKKLLCQISGYSEPEDGRTQYKMIVQPLELMPSMNVDTGDFRSNVRANQLIRRYISRQLWQRAQSAVRAGYDHIPNEEREFTFLFADLVSYTAFAEKASSEEIIEMLNLSIGATAATVLHSGGFVDKIMGDSIFAVFQKPMDAILAAIEIQKQFNILNLFRVKQEQPEVQLRVGIHTGMCVLASIGSDEFMELTFIGDAVNTASRLEKACLPGQLLVSRVTVNMLNAAVEVIREVELEVKGKSAKLPACYVNAITTEGPHGPIKVGLDDMVF